MESASSDDYPGAAGRGGGGYPSGVGAGPTGTGVGNGSKPWETEGDAAQRLERARIAEVAAGLAARLAGGWRAGSAIY